MIQSYTTQTPIALIFFNRADYVLQTLASIKKVQPKRLYLIADGPRDSIESDKIKCSNTRLTVESFIDWKCEIIKIYSDVNLGCRERITTGITTCFTNEESLIILEDDCVPSISFYRYCDQLIVKYSDSQHIKMISGCNLIQNYQINQDYCYSKYAGIWGWATWKRAWPKQQIKCSYARNIVDQYPFLEKVYWLDKLKKIECGKLNTWDYLWDIYRIKDNGLSIVPKYNLISNIGFDADATHTKMLNSPFSKMDALNLEFPLDEPAKIEANKEYEYKYRSKLMFGSNFNILKLIIKYIFT